MMEAARTSEMLVNFYQTTRRYNPEDSHLHRSGLLRQMESLVHNELTVVANDLRNFERHIPQPPMTYDNKEKVCVTVTMRTD
jgi:hypothetical protein